MASKPRLELRSFYLAELKGEVWSRTLRMKQMTGIAQLDGRQAASGIRPLDRE